jgi:nitrous oxide reductase family maturation protein NosD
MRALLLTFAATLLALPAQARTWTVGGSGADFPLIAPAIAAAAPGDTILVRRGVYRENLFIDKTLRLVGEGEPTLFGLGVGSVVTIVAPECEVRGFHIEGSGSGETNEMDAGVQIASGGNRVAGNRLRRVFYGIVAANAAGNRIEDNDIEGYADKPFGQRGDGVYLYRAPDSMVSRNRISGERDAIYFQYAPRGQALDNVVSSSRYGLHDMFSDDAVITGNTFGDSSVGANIMNSRRIRVERNSVLRNRGVPGVGIAFKECDDSTLVGNVLAGNARGLMLDGSSMNRFVGNRFHLNDVAVTLFSSAERNAFAGNEFAENWSDLVLNGRDSGTAWSIEGRGNFWSRYAGFDFDGDGIGDAPHGALGAFERLEGSTPAARLFLLSPAAAGLALAARLSGRTPEDAVDARPLVRASDGARRARAESRGGFSRAAAGFGRAEATGAILLIAACAVTLRRTR